MEIDMLKIKRKLHEDIEIAIAEFQNSTNIFIEQIKVTRIIGREHFSAVSAKTADSKLILVV